MNAGQITVEVFRIGEPVSTTSSGSSLPNLGLGSKVHEKALKGDPKYHGASYVCNVRIHKMFTNPNRLGNARTIPAPTYATTSKIDGDDSPILKILFKYRSNSMLFYLFAINYTNVHDRGVERAYDHRTKP